jgi:hypothetical protein
MEQSPFIEGPVGIPSVNFEYFIPWVGEFFRNFPSMLSGGEAVPAVFQTGWFYVQVMGTIISLILLTGIIYCVLRLYQIRAEEYELYNPSTEAEKTVQQPGNERWDLIESHLKTDNPNDWKLAIIEADILLDEMVTRMGYAGNSLGEKLRQIERSDFNTLDQAWEAHKSRNMVAHSGSDFVLTRHEALRIIDLYRQVFQEFFLIQ